MSLQKQAYLDWISCAASTTSTVDAACASASEVLTEKIETLTLDTPFEEEKIGTNAFGDCLRDTPPKMSDDQFNQWSVAPNLSAVASIPNDSGRLADNVPSAEEGSDVNLCPDEQPLTFGELMTLVQKGEPIPGVEELNIQATNTDPTESTRPVAKKPWET